MNSVESKALIIRSHREEEKHFTTILEQILKMLERFVAIGASGVIPWKHPIKSMVSLPIGKFFLLE